MRAFFIYFLKKFYSKNYFPILLPRLENSSKALAKSTFVKSGNNLFEK